MDNLPVERGNQAFKFDGYTKHSNAGILPIMNSCCISYFYKVIRILLSYAAWLFPSSSGYRILLTVTWAVGWDIMREFLELKMILYETSGSASDAMVMPNLPLAQRVF